VTGSALRWAGLNLCCEGLPGLRQRLAGAARSGALDAGSIAGSVEGLLPPGWAEAAEAELERARRFGAGVLTPEDEGYPALLRAASDPPLLLYVWGSLRPEDVLAVAVVGSRRATPHGVAVARGISRGLAEAGFTVVSGLARGIDAAGHRGALDAGGRTLAVLGSGLDRIYPAEHRALAETIAARGAVLSEFPFGTPPLQRNFPRRNRVIAWISWATVVVEAARDSGSLITAARAAEEGRAVHAVPGPVGSINAEGTNALLRDGALVCRGAGDVLEDLAPQVVEAARGLAPAGAPGPGATGAEGETSRRAGGSAAVAGPGATASLTPEERLVLERVPAVRGIGIERLGEACGLAPGPLLAALLELELKGLVRQLPGRHFMSAACKI
jgi:DNA processing protein